MLDHSSELYLCTEQPCGIYVKSKFPPVHSQVQYQSPILHYCHMLFQHDIHILICMMKIDCRMPHLVVYQILIFQQLTAERF